LDPSRKNSPIFIQLARPISLAQSLETAATALDDILKRGFAHKNSPVVMQLARPIPFAQLLENAATALDDGLKESFISKYVYLIHLDCFT
jgi:hypothetical protein